MRHKCGTGPQFMSKALRAMIPAAGLGKLALSLESASRQNRHLFSVARTCKQQVTNRPIIAPPKGGDCDRAQAKQFACCNMFLPRAESPAALKHQNTEHSFGAELK